MSIFITEVPPAGDGIRLAVKDLFDTAGVRTTCGSAIFGDHVPETTATAVARLEAAGYVNVGKANMHEFAWGITSENPHYGTVPNPRAPGRIAGGSSGGSAAALAARLADAALGTDTGGSIRIPAACCGVVGFKPTYGLVPLDGCFPLAPGLDHAGPMANDVTGCERMLDELAPGFAPRTDVALGDLRVGVAWTEHAAPLVRARVEDAVERLPHTRPLALPFAEGTEPAFFREVAEVHADLWPEHREEYGADLQHKLARAMRVTDAEAAAGLRARALYREEVAEAMADVDLVLTPTLTRVAARTGLGDVHLRAEVLRLTAPWNVVGGPALALPCGTAEDGLPASLQLLGRPGDDALVLAAGRALEAAI